MGVFIDYELRAKCTDEDLQSHLENIRQRCLDLPLRAVGQVRRIEPVYNPLTFRFLLEAGHTLPELIAQRLNAAEEDPKHGDRCLSFLSFPEADLPDNFQKRYFAPALDFINHTTLWKKEDLPEKVGDKTPWGSSTLTIMRAGIELDFANVLLRYGYVLLIDPGEGSETVALALSTYGTPGENASSALPLWYGKSFTKTQYAKDFIRVHETVCRVLDIVQEEGLLLSGDDTCGYYASRTWEEASENVNEELMFARLVGGMMGVGIGNLREEGVSVQVIEDNASKAKPVDFSSVLKHRPDKKKGKDSGNE